MLATTILRGGSAFEFGLWAVNFRKTRDPDGMRRVGMVSDTHARMICPICIFPVHLSWKYAAKLGHPITSAGAP